MALSPEQKKALVDLRLLDQRKISHFRIDQAEKYRELIEGMAEGRISYNPDDLRGFLDEINKKQLPGGGDGAL